MDLRQILCYCDNPMRVSTFTAAFLVANAVDGCVIETGCSRGIAGDGNSTIMLAEFAKQKGVPFYSCDYDPAMIEVAKKLVGDRPVNWVCADSKVWLASFDHPISLCYLDSYDYEESNPDPCQIHQLNEFVAIEKRIVKNGALLLDDFGLPHEGKCGMTKAHISHSGGWRLLNEEYQLLYVKQ